MLSILSGKYKGHKLSCPKSGTRPTSSLVKKALFDVIRTELHDAQFCDLFAGSGAVGLEALSQGAKKVFLIEAAKSAFMCIKDNISSLKCTSDCQVYLKKASSFLEAQKDHLHSIDFFFIDPPYDISESDSSSYEMLLKAFSQYNLKKGCYIICETKDEARIEKPLAELEALNLLSKKKYGDSFLYFIAKY